MKKKEMKNNIIPVLKKKSYNNIIFTIITIIF